MKSLGEETKLFLPFSFRRVAKRERLRKEKGKDRGEIMKPNRNNSTREYGNRGALGFSLIELLVVVAVILIIVAIAIPNFIQSKIRANESGAVENLRTITTGEVIYSTTYGIGFSPDLPSLGGTGASITPSNAELIDEVLSAGTKSGFQFTYNVVTTDPQGNVTAYTVNADPTVPNYTGNRHFYTDQTSVIRQNDSAPAGPTDNPIQ